MHFRSIPIQEFTFLRDEILLKIKNVPYQGYEKDLYSDYNIKFSLLCTKEGRSIGYRVKLINVPRIFSRPKAVFLFYSGVDEKVRKMSIKYDDAIIRFFSSGKMLKKNYALVLKIAKKNEDVSN